jgi:hypothetical protein
MLYKSQWHRNDVQNMFRHWGLMTAV